MSRPLVLCPQADRIRAHLAPATAERVDRTLALLRERPELGTPLFGPLSPIRSLSPGPGLRLLYLLLGDGIRILRLQVASPPRPPQARLGAVVLAAGRHRVQRRPHQLAPVGDRPSLVRTVGAFLDAAVDEVVVVLGYEAPRIRTVLDRSFPRGCAPADPLGIDRLVVTETDREPGPMSRSLQRGVDLMPPGVEGVLVGLGNRPLVESATIDRLIDEFRRERPLIARPSYRGQPGHPVLFDAALLKDLGRLRGEGGGRELVERHAADLLDLVVDDPGVVRTTKEIVS